MPSWLRGTAAHHLRSVLALAVATLLLGACQLHLEINVTVDQDGSGEVEVAVGLDRDAALLRPDLAQELALSDLTDAGWDVVGPRRERDDMTWIRVRHGFESPDDLQLLVDQIAGGPSDGSAQGPFRDFALRRSDAFSSSTYDFTGTVDFSRGLATFSDDAATEVLDDEPLGTSVSGIESQFGAAINQLVQIQVAVRLPGTVESNAPTQASNGAVWRPSVTDDGPIHLVASGTVTRTERILWAGVAVVTGLVLVLFLLIRLASHVRERRTPANSEGVGVDG